MLKFLLSFSLFLFAFVARAQTIKIEGLVLDSKTKEPLAFVSVCTENRTCGVSSDIDGKFELKLKEAPKKLYFSYVGYEMFELNDVKENNLVYLKSNSHELQEVVIRAGENPAHIIIRKVQKNKEQNNPVDYKSYQYKAYNKLFITATKDTIGNSKEDTTFLKAKNFLSRQHLFMMEQVLTKKHVSPNKEYSEVLASKVSGFQDPSFLNLFTQMVSFSFYNDLISISDKNYLNPIAEGSFGKYHLILEDTLFNEGDSTFVISFYPRKGKNFDGLKGVLKINSNGYAMENLIAQPMEYNQGTSIKMQQLY